MVGNITVTETPTEHPSGTVFVNPVDPVNVDPVNPVNPVNVVLADGLSRWFNGNAQERADTRSEVSAALADWHNEFPVLDWSRM